MPRTVVVYHYHELDETHRSNLEFFLNCGFDDELDYILIIAGGCTLELPCLSNLKVVHIANAGTDFAGYAHAVNHAIDIERYRHFIFLNSTVCGPFLPSYHGPRWADCFVSMLSGNVHLCGATINILSDQSFFNAPFKERYGFEGPYAHVQTMIFCLSRQALEFLIGKGFFRRPLGPTKNDIIIDYELLLSQLIIHNGWNISCLLAEYTWLDYGRITGDINPTSYHGDACYSGRYFGRSIHPYEAVFIKNNRDVISKPLLDGLKRTQAVLSRSQRRCAVGLSLFDRVTGNIPSAWKGHKNFALWLVNRLRPRTIVELGVDFGFSSFCFAHARIGRVYGIDSFEGDKDAGLRDTRTSVEECVKTLKLDNLTLIKGYFEEVSKTWTEPIDILHIDGRHHYEDVSRDFSDWAPFVASGGIILLHDTCVEHFGVRRFFGEIDMPKCNFWNSHGLGLVSRDQSLLDEIARVFETLIEKPGDEEPVPKLRS